MQIAFSPPDIDEADIAAVSDVLRSGWITTGPKAAEFEQALAEYCGTPKVACLNSATAALECALQLLAIGPGDEVIVPAYTYTATASVVCHVGATPVLVDVAPGSYQMDPERIVESITPRTKALISVDIGGVMCDYDALIATISNTRVSRKFEPRAGTMQRLFDRLPVIADAAHSFGASYHGRPSGTVADITAFSFHAIKNLTTAEGGALTWRADLGDSDFHEGMYNKIKLFRLHGQTKDALDKTEMAGLAAAGAQDAAGAPAGQAGQAGQSEPNGDYWEYDVIAPLYKCNMTDIAAALGLSQLSRYDRLLARRQDMIKLYNNGLLADALAGGYALDILPHNDGAGSISSGHLMMVRLLGRDDAFRRRLIKAMAERGVACNVHFKPLPMLSAYMALGFDVGSYPNAWQQYQNEVSLPLHTQLTDEQIAYVCESFAAAYRECLDA